MTPKTLPEPASTAREFDLLVSVATLVRVLFDHPQDGEWALAPERKATVLEAAGSASMSERNPLAAESGSGIWRRSEPSLAIFSLTANGRGPSLTFDF